MKSEQNNKIRFIIFLVLASVLYFVFFYELFLAKRALVAGLLFCIFFIVLPFLAIDLRKVKKIWIYWTIFFVGLILSMLLPQNNWQTVIALWISLLGTAWLLRYLWEYFSEVRKVARFQYFSRTGYWFTMIMTIMFGFALLGMNSSFPFSCDQIWNRSDKIIQTSTNPLSLWSSQQGDAQKLPLPKKEEKSEFETELSKLWWNLRTNVRWGLVDTQKTINFKVCSVVLEQLTKLYQNPVFQIAAIFAIYLLLYWVVRLLVWVITILGYCCFLILKRCKVYKKKKILVEVDEID